MALYKVYDIDGIGTVRVAKKKGVKRLTLRLHSSGEIRVSQPYYLPYSAGAHFAKTQKAWVATQRDKQQAIVLKNNMPIGKQHTFIIEESHKHTTRVSNNTIKITVTTNESIYDPLILANTKKAIKRALIKEAKELLPQRLESLATTHGYHYSGISVKPMKVRWGSCSSHRHITLNCYLTMLPWDIIDYVIMHELSHTKYMNHGAAFWNEVGATTPNFATLKKELKKRQPAIHALYV